MPWPRFGTRFPCQFLTCCLLSLIFARCKGQGGTVLPGLLKTPLEVFLVNNSQLLPLPYEPPPVDPSRPKGTDLERFSWTYLVITFSPEFPRANTSLLFQINRKLVDFTEGLSRWLSPPTSLAVIPFSPLDNRLQMPGLPGTGPNLTYISVNSSHLELSTYEQCKYFYRCLFPYVAQSNPSLPQIGSDSRDAPNAQNMRECLAKTYNKTLLCPLAVQNVNYRPVDNCAVYAGQLAPNDWISRRTDEQLQIFWESGVDYSNIWWPGANAESAAGSLYQYGEPLGNNTNNSLSFSEAIGRQLLGDAGLGCNLETPCKPTLDCRNVGSHVALGLGRGGTFPEAWALYVTTALRNINDHMSNQYLAIKGAAIQATLSSFNIQDFYPKPRNQFSLLNVLQGLTTAFALLGGAIPGPGAIAFGSTSASVGAVGGYLGRYVTPSSGQLAAPQERFADSVLAIYVSLVEGLDSMANVLFRGETIDEASNYTIFQMMKGGSWLNRNNLQRVSNIEKQLTIEIISRSIDQLWKVATSNKIFVVYVDLNDTANSTANCVADSSGPPAFKYCADGGVYYTYNFIEAGRGNGYLSWPWGSQNLTDKFNIDPAWITEASAKTYKFSKAIPEIQFDPFNFTLANASSTFLQKSLQIDPTLDLTKFGGRFPGSWTVPVCNTSTWGRKWNWNYINNTGTREILIVPCMCGPGGNETKAWVRAAGMLNFNTYYEACKHELLDKEWKFQWPENVTSVDFGFKDPIKKPK